MSNLLHLKNNIDLKNVRGLNLDSSYPISNLFIENEIVKSSDDEQMILHIPFLCPIKLASINIVATSTSDERPNNIHVFVNKPNMNFQDVYDVTPMEILEFPEDDIIRSYKFKLKFTNFQKVQSLVLFIEDNFGADVTSIESVDFYGFATNSMDLKKLKKC